MSRGRVKTCNDMQRETDVVSDELVVYDLG